MKKELPILFSSEMIRAILAGRKGVTRRVIKPQPDFAKLKKGVKLVAHRCPVLGITHKPPEWGLYCDEYKAGKVPAYGFNCPQGQEGDILWVKETHAQIYNGEACRHEDDDWGKCDFVKCGGCHIEYKADTGAKYPAGWDKETIEELAPDEYPTWKSPLFMKKEYSRIDLENLGVRVEAVQDISEEDVIKEGVFKKQGYWCSTIHPIKGTYQAWPTAIIAFKKLWDSINAKPKRVQHNPYTRSKQDCYVSYPWENIREERQHRGLIWHVVGNPQVFVIKFKRLKP